MSENKKSYYAIIPANVRYDKTLKANAKLLYGEITALCNEKGYCWANNNYFANLYEVKKETASRWISNLEQSGYIRVQLVYGKGTKQVTERRIYLGNDNIINTSCQNEHEGIDNKVNRGNDKIVKDNTTSLNTTSNTTVNIKNSASNNAQPTHLNSNDITIKDKSTPNKTDLVNAFFEELWLLYPNKRGKGTIKTAKKNELYKLGDEFKRCITRYIEDVEQQRRGEFKELKFKNGSTFFNSGYVDYLDVNYKGVVEGEFSRSGIASSDGTIKKVDLSHITESRQYTEQESRELEKWAEENDIM